MGNLISIIVPAYQKENAIKSCIDSILAQTYKNIEIIIVYLEGTDKTTEILKTYQDKRIRLIQQTGKSGPGGARNIGVNEAKGKYLGFVDCDDYIPADFYEKLHNAIEISGADIAWGEIILNKNKQTPVIKHEKQNILNSFTEKFSLVKNGAAFDKLFSTDLIKKNQIFFQEDVFYEDNPFILEAFFCSDKIVTVPSAVYYYAPDEKKPEYLKKLKQSVLPVAKNMMHFCHEHQMDETEQEIVKTKILISFAAFFLEHRDIYLGLKEIFGNGKLIRKKHYKKVYKKARKWLFSFSIKKKTLTVFGTTFKFNKRKTNG